MWQQRILDLRIKDIDAWLTFKLCPFYVQLTTLDILFEENLFQKLWAELKCKLFLKNPIFLYVIINQASWVTCNNFYMTPCLCVFICNLCICACIYTETNRMVPFTQFRKLLLDTTFFIRWRPGSLKSKSTNKHSTKNMFWIKRFIYPSWHFAYILKIC